MIIIWYPVMLILSAIPGRDMLGAEWNRLQRTPSSFPTPPAWKAETDRGGQEEQTREHHDKTENEDRDRYMYCCADQSSRAYQCPKAPQEHTRWASMPRGGARMYAHSACERIPLVLEWYHMGEV